MIVVELLDQYADRLEPGDIELLERLLRESRTWALVDGLAASVVGPLVERYGELGAVLDRWAADGDFWIRRSALLALLKPLRRGEGDFDRFSRYADAMLDDDEFFIRKAIGWVLRDTARKRPDLVFAWLLPWASRASGVTIREAVKPLSEQQRNAILAARLESGADVLDPITGDLASVAAGKLGQIRRRRRSHRTWRSPPPATGVRNSAIGAVMCVSSRITSRLPSTTGQTSSVQNQSVVSTNVTPWSRAATTSAEIRSGSTASARAVAHADASSRCSDRQAGGSCVLAGLSPITRRRRRRSASRSMVASVPSRPLLGVGGVLGVGVGDDDEVGLVAARSRRSPGRGTAGRCSAAPASARRPRRPGSRPWRARPGASRVAGRSARAARTTARRGSRRRAGSSARRWASPYSHGCSWALAPMLTQPSRYGADRSRADAERRAQVRRHRDRTRTPGAAPAASRRRAGRAGRVGGSGVASVVDRVGGGRHGGDGGRLQRSTVDAAGAAMPLGVTRRSAAASCGAAASTPPSRRTVGGAQVQPDADHQQHIARPRARLRHDTAEK